MLVLLPVNGKRVGASAWLGSMALAWVLPQKHFCGVGSVMPSIWTFSF